MVASISLRVKGIADKDALHGAIEDFRVMAILNEDEGMTSDFVEV